MKNYKFSLESVLEVRSNEEQNVLEGFVLVQNRLVEEEKKRERFQNELNICLGRNICSKNISDLMMRNHYKLDLEEKIKIQEKIIQERKIELEGVRKKLQAAQKDKKVIEKLKEKDLDEYKTELSKKNQKEIDEFAVLRFKSSYNM